LESSHSPYQGTELELRSSDSLRRSTIGYSDVAHTRPTLPTVRPDGILRASGSEGTDSKAASSLTAEGQCRLGLELYSHKRLGETVKAFKKAIDLDPSHGESYVQIGSILAADPHSREQAISYLREGSRLSPGDSVAHGLLAVLYRQEKRYDDSIAESRKAIAISPQSAPLHLVLGTTLEESKRYEEAIGELQEANRLRSITLVPTTIWHCARRRPAPRRRQNSLGSPT